jgi:hypothetical protein
MDVYGAGMPGVFNVGHELSLSEETSHLLKPKHGFDEKEHARAISGPGMSFVPK